MKINIKNVLLIGSITIASSVVSRAALINVTNIDADGGGGGIFSSTVSTAGNTVTYSFSVLVQM